MLDIPDTGAIFIIGDCYLKNNQENYFFIKNDPVRQIYANYYGQNGVVCESGRLFVWGHNQYRQLGIGPKDMVTKPTVIRQLRDNGIKVKDVAFGYQFTVVLTEDNRVFFAGRSIFPPNSRIYSFKDKFLKHSDTTEFTESFVELSEFDYFTQLEMQDFDRVFAGGNHFVVLTQCGRLIGWGQPGGGQLGEINEYRLTKEPQFLSGTEKVNIVVCGNEYTLVVTDNNQMFVSGKFNYTHSPKFTQINTSGVESKIAFVHTSIIEEICLITANHEIFISKSRDSLQSFSFFKLTLLEGCDKIVKLESGSTFLSFLTETQRFFTNYKDSDGLTETPEFHEIEKFNEFNITTFKCGLDYILLKGVPKLDAFGVNENRVHRPLLTKTFTEEPWDNNGRQTGDGFSQASTESPQDVQKKNSPQSFDQIVALNKIKGGAKNKIKFIENGVELLNQSDEEGNFITAEIKEHVNNVLGEPVRFYPDDIANVNDKEITKRILMAEGYNRTPQRHMQPKVRINTPVPRAAFMDSSGSTTDESDHSVDDDLNRKQNKVDNPIIAYMKKARDKWLEFENNCKESNTVIPNDHDMLEKKRHSGVQKTERQRANELAISQHLPNSFICSIQ